MGRDRAPKHKRSRREGVDLFGTGGESLQKRLNQPPGQHGPGAAYRNRRRSEFALQLREKQKVKRMYGMRESQFQRFFRQALRSREQTGAALLKLLERRLDNVVYRLGFARTRAQARQFVTHRHIRVDGDIVNIPSFLVSPGQEVKVEPDLLQIPDVQEQREANLPAPGWLEPTQNGGRVLREPDRSEIDQDIQETLIVEFYSR